MNGDLLFWGALAFGSVVVAWALVTDDGATASKRQHELERRLKRYPASARAVIIKAQPRRALWRQLPSFVLALGLMLGLPYLQHGGLPALCHWFDAAEIVWWAMGLLCYGLPGLLALLLGAEARLVVRVLQGGYAPPLDAVLMQDTVAVTGWRASARCVIDLSFVLLLASAGFYGGHALYQDFGQPEFQARVAAKCAASTLTKTKASRA